MLYLIWMVLTVVPALFCVIHFWPDYNANEFLLFTDLTSVFLFTPSFFLLSFGVLSQILMILLKRNLARTLSLISLFCLTLLLSFTILEYSFLFKAIISVIGSAIGFLYFIISTTILKKVITPKHN